jgi:hypothetical protein
MEDSSADEPLSGSKPQIPNGKACTNFVLFLAYVGSGGVTLPTR